MWVMELLGLHLTTKKKIRSCKRRDSSSVSFDTFMEYDTLVVNSWDGLGSHTCQCGSTSVNENEQLEITTANIYPNPSNSGAINIEVEHEVSLIEIYSPEGKLVESIVPAVNARKIEFNSSDWNSGVYFVNLRYATGTTFSHRVVIR